MKLSQLFENSDTTSLEQEVNQYLEAGEIVNPEYIDLKYRVNKAIDRATRQIKTDHVHGKGSEIRDTFDDALMDLIYSVPSSSNEVLALKNKLARVKAKDHELYKALKKFYDEHVNLAQKVKDLKEKVVKTAVKRQQAKDEKATAMQKKFTDSASLINVLTQHIDEYTARAVKMAGNQIAAGLEVLERANWSLNQAAPYPKGVTVRATYLSALEKRNFLESISENVGTDQDLRRASASKRKAIEQQAEKSAHGNYMAWVAKMIDKIGKTVENAKMSGSPWTGSILRVTTHDGEEQVWNNKMIINQSKYGTLFNQFPSRRVK